MNKAEAYPWIGVAIGIIAGILLSVIVRPHSNYILLNTIVFGITFGCIYGYAIEKSNRAILIGGIVGCLFGLHPAPFFAFAFGGAFVVLHTLPDLIFKNTTWLGLLVIAIIGEIMGLFSVIILSSIGYYFTHTSGPLIDTSDLRIVAFLVLAAIPYLNIIYGISVGGAFGICFGRYLLPILLFPVPLLAFAGYGIGKIMNEKAFKRVERERKIREYKSKMEQWKREGYDVSELEEVLK